MLHVVRSEWTKLMRPGMLLGGAGALIVLGVLGTFVVFSMAEHAEAGQGPAQPADVLEESDGFARSFAFSSQVLGATTLVLFARIVTADYQQGTLKVLLSREPSRTRLLAGKGIAMALFVAAALLVALVAMLAVAVTAGSANDIDLDAWWTADGIASMAWGVLRLLASCLVWGLFGLGLGALVKNGAAANGLGIGGIAVGGHLMEMFWDDAGKWLPDLVLAAFSMGGSNDLSLGDASWVVALYAAVLAAASWFFYTRGDVTT
jgi:ABC-2 type transport system permease protein